MCSTAPSVSRASLPFLSRAISARKLELFLAMAASTGLSFMGPDGSSVGVSGAVAACVARHGHSNVDPFRRGDRVSVTVDGKQFESTQAQLRLLQLLEPLPVAEFIRAHDADIARFAQERRQVREVERKRRACHRVHIEAKAAHGLPVAAWLDAEESLVVDA